MLKTIILGLTAAESLGSEGDVIVSVEMAGSWANLRATLTIRIVKLAALDPPSLVLFNHKSVHV